MERQHLRNWYQEEATTNLSWREKEKRWCNQSQQLESPGKGWNHYTPTQQDLVAQMCYRHFQRLLSNRQGGEATLWLSPFPTSCPLPGPPRMLPECKPNISLPGNLKKTACRGQLHAPSFPLHRAEQGKGREWIREQTVPRLAQDQV